MSKMYLINEASLAFLVRAVHQLEWLQMNGVDNWSGYSSLDIAVTNKAREKEMIERGRVSLDAIDDVGENSLFYVLFEDVAELVD